MLKKRTILPLFLLVGFLALLLTGHAESGVKPASLPAIPAAVSLAPGSGPVHMPGEQGVCFAVSGLNNAPVHIGVKDFHKFVYHPLAEKQHIERKNHSYIYFTETFPSSESLSRLHRLNI